MAKVIMIQGTMSNAGKSLSDESFRWSLSPGWTEDVSDGCFPPTKSDFLTGCFKSAGENTPRFLKINRFNIVHELQMERI